ncbi:hypothetical protein HUG17_10436 [Dermatophagoides farinae]|uniref:Uncharacterized protein n=1 Tax=Dermatophagoides farinae TaxID=6954 RepID=A0A9D4NQD7_DERFA|nr:hypothetical protein HUG17_10436 [Dermatophagoides farinae]
MTIFHHYHVYAHDFDDGFDDPNVPYSISLPEHHLIIEEDEIKTIEKQYRYCRIRYGIPSVCRPRGLCHYQYGDVRYSSKESCQTSVNGKNVGGVCCSLDVDYTTNSRDKIPYRLKEPRKTNEEPIRISRDQFLQAIKQADADVARYLVLEEVFTGELGQVQVAFTPASFLQMMFGPADQNQQLSNLWGFRALQLTRALGENLNLSLNNCVMDYH